MLKKMLKFAMVYANKCGDFVEDCILTIRAAHTLAVVRVSNFRFMKWAASTTFARSQLGFAGMQILISLLGVVITIIILANAIPILWPMATTASENVTAMTGTDSGTEMIVQFWPVALLVIGIGLAVGVVIYGLKTFGLMS